MLTTPTITPLAAAERDLAQADASVQEVERNNASGEQRFGELHERLQEVTATRGTGHSEARKLAAAIATMSEDIMTRRQRLGIARRRRNAVSARVASEREAIQIAERDVAEQEQRVGVQRQAIEKRERELAESYTALEIEQRVLRDRKLVLAQLIGEGE